MVAISHGYATDTLLSGDGDRLGHGTAGGNDPEAIVGIQNSNRAAASNNLHVGVPVH
jgi:hypothetical protein